MNLNASHIEFTLNMKQEFTVAEARYTRYIHRLEEEKLELLKMWDVRESRKEDLKKIEKYMKLGDHLNK